MEKQPNIIKLEQVLGEMTSLLEKPVTPENCKEFHRMTQEYQRALGQFDLFNPPEGLLGYSDRGSGLMEIGIVKYLGGRVAA